MRCGDDGEAARHRDRQENGQGATAGSARKPVEGHGGGSHFGISCGARVPWTPDLSLTVLAWLSRTIPTPWIVPRGSWIVTGPSVSARPFLGTTRSDSAVNVTW